MNDWLPKGIRALNLSSLLRFFRSSNDISDLVMEPMDAISEMRRRSADEALRKRVLEYLGNDIPAYFRSDPVLYLARYIATPNFETLRFLHVTEPLGMRVVVTQDKSDIFVPHNHVKRALGKMSICHRVSQQNEKTHEQYEKFTIINFNASANKQFRYIKTNWGENLVDFHSRLLAPYVRRGVEICDDTEWINRNNRGDLVEHYKKFLALFLVHGIIFEDYVMDDEREADFVQNVLRPAFRFVENKFGVKPLIAQLVPRSVESSQYWISYPPEIKAIVQNAQGL